MTNRSSRYGRSVTPRSVGNPRDASGARQTRCLGAGALDFVHRLRGARGEHVTAVRCDQHVVLDADADPAQLPRHGLDDRPDLRLLLVLHLLGGRGAEVEAALPHLVLAEFPQVIRDRLTVGVEIEPGLHRQHHAGLELSGRAVDLVVPHVVHVHAEPVAGPVHVELAVVVHRERLLDPARQRAQRDEPLGQDAPGGREPAVDRERPRDVRGVVAPLAPGVDQQQVALLHAAVVLAVVEDARVGARGDDRRVAVARRAVHAEDVFERRLHLVLVEPRPRIAHRLGVRLAADLAGPAMAQELGRRASQTQLVEDRPGVIDPHGGGVAAGPRRAQVRDQSRHPAVERAAAQSIDDHRAVDHILAELLVEPVDRVGGVGAVGRDGALDPGPPAGPDLHLAVARADKEDEPLLGIRGVEDGDGVGLVEPRQEEEVGGLTKLVVDVAVAPELPGAGDDRQGVADRRREALPPLDEGGWIEWAHRRNNTTAKGERPMHIGMAAVFQNPDKARTDREVYCSELRLADLAEPLGFESIWGVEHHFTDYTMCPDVLQFLTYMAGRTERAGLGSMVVVLPWHDPLRVAEEVSTLDHISGGRVILGLGRGAGKVEFDGFRLSMDESRPRFVESAETLLRGLEAGYCEYAGTFVRQPRAAIRPAPFKSFHGRTYAAAVSPESMPVMARLGVGILIIPQKPWKEVARELDSYRSVYREVNGVDAPPPVSAGWTFCDASAERAEQMARRYIGGY